MRPEDLTTILELLGQVSSRLEKLPLDGVGAPLRSELAGAQKRAASLTMSLLSVQRAIERPAAIRRLRDEGNDEETLH
jgi:hypothetical protein